MLYALLQQQVQDHGLDGTCWKIISIAGALLTAVSSVVVALWKENRKLVKERLDAEEKGKQVLRELYERMLERMKR